MRASPNQDRLQIAPIDPQLVTAFKLEAVGLNKSQAELFTELWQAYLAEKESKGQKK